MCFACASWSVRLIPPLGQEALPKTSLGFSHLGPSPSPLRFAKVIQKQTTMYDS